MSDEEEEEVEVKAPKSGSKRKAPAVIKKAAKVSASGGAPTFTFCIPAVMCLSWVVESHVTCA